MSETITLKVIISTRGPFILERGELRESAECPSHFCLMYLIWLRKGGRHGWQNRRNCHRKPKKTARPF